MKPTTYTCPPAAKISARLGCDLETAKTARALMRGDIRITENPDFPRTNDWRRSCYNEPRRIELILEALNELLDMHGVEAFRDEDCLTQASLSYLNAGDTYADTLLFFHDSGAFRLGCWGDVVERNERLTTF